jgi:hypothetical protein
MFENSEHPLQLTADLLKNNPTCRPAANKSRLLKTSDAHKVSRWMQQVKDRAAQKKLSIDRREQVDEEEVEQG